MSGELAQGMRVAIFDAVFQRVSLLFLCFSSCDLPVFSPTPDRFDALIGWHAEGFGNVESDRFLFPSRQTAGAIDRRTAHEALKKAFEAAGLNGKLATHTMRKSFAQRLYDQTADIFAVQEMLGHKSVATTQRYLGVNYATVREAVEKMAFSATEREIDTLSTQTLKTTSDNALFLELAMRGYDLSALRNSQIVTVIDTIPTAEIQSV